MAMPAAGAQPSLQPPGRPTPQTPCPAPLSACLPACLSVCPQSKKSLEFWQGQEQAGTPCIDVTEVVAAVRWWRPPAWAAAFHLICCSLLLPSLSRLPPADVDCRRAQLLLMGGQQSRGAVASTQCSHQVGGWLDLQGGLALAGWLATHLRLLLTQIFENR